MSRSSVPPLRILALVLAWSNVAAVFQMFARPVRESADAQWPAYLGVVIVLALLGATGAYGLWEQRAWARKVLGVWGAGIVVAVATLFLMRG